MLLKKNTIIYLRFIKAHNHTALINRLREIILPRQHPNEENNYPEMVRHLFFYSYAKRYNINYTRNLHSTNYSSVRLRATLPVKTTPEAAPRIKSMNY